MNRISIEICFMIFVAVLAIAVVMLFVINTLKQRKQLNKLKANNKKIILFYANWCKYSQQFKPTWKSLYDTYNGIYSMEKYNVETDISISNSFDIQSVPVIYLVSNGKKKKYDGEKSYSNLVTFIDSTFNNII
jgi:thioredoxin-like negative regulator of GroEL